MSLVANGWWPRANHIERQRNLGEMSELAEGARLEIVCTVNSGTEGSNPSLSARSLPAEVIPVTGNL